MLNGIKIKLKDIPDIYKKGDKYYFNQDENSLIDELNGNGNINIEKIILPDRGEFLFDNGLSIDKEILDTLSQTPDEIFNHVGEGTTLNRDEKTYHFNNDKKINKIVDGNFVFEKEGAGGLTLEDALTITKEKFLSGNTSAMNGLEANDKIKIGNSDYVIDTNGKLKPKSIDISSLNEIENIKDLIADNSIENLEIDNNRAKELIDKGLIGKIKDNSLTITNDVIKDDAFINDIKDHLSKVKDGTLSNLAINTDTLINTIGHENIGKVAPGGISITDDNITKEKIDALIPHKDKIRDNSLENLTLSLTELESTDIDNIKDKIKDGGMSITKEDTFTKDDLEKLYSIKEKIKSNSIESAEISDTDIVDIVNNLGDAFKDGSIKLNLSTPLTADKLDEIKEYLPKLKDNSITDTIRIDTNLLKSLSEDSLNKFADGTIELTDSNITVDDLVSLEDKLSKIKNNSIEDINVNVENLTNIDNGVLAKIKDGNINVEGKVDSNNLSNIMSLIDKIKNGSIDEIDLSLEQAKTPSIIDNLKAKIANNSLGITHDEALTSSDLLAIAPIKDKIKDNSLSNIKVPSNEITNNPLISKFAPKSITITDSLTGANLQDVIDNISLIKDSSINEATLTHEQIISHKDILSPKLADNSLNLSASTPINSDILKSLLSISSKLKDNAIENATLSSEDLDDISQTDISKIKDGALTLSTTGSMSYEGLLNLDRLADKFVNLNNIGDVELTLPQIKDLATNKSTLFNKIADNTVIIPNDNPISYSEIRGLSTEVVGKIKKSAITSLDVTTTEDLDAFKQDKDVYSNGILNYKVEGIINNSTLQNLSTIVDKLANNSLSNISLTKDEFLQSDNTFESKIKNGGVTLSDAVDSDFIKDNETKIGKLADNSISNLSVSKDDLATIIRIAGDKLKDKSLTISGDTTLSKQDFDSIKEHFSKLADGAISKISLSMDDLKTLSDSDLLKIADEGITLSGNVGYSDLVSLGESALSKIKNNTVENVTLTKNDLVGEINQNVINKIKDSHITMSDDVLTATELDKIVTFKDKLSTNAIKNALISVEKLTEYKDSIGLDKINNGSIAISDGTHTNAMLKELKDAGLLLKIKDNSIRGFEVTSTELSALTGDETAKIEDGSLSISEPLDATKLVSIHTNIGELADNSIGDVTLELSEVTTAITDNVIPKLANNSITINNATNVNATTLANLARFGTALKDNTIQSATMSVTDFIQNMTGSLNNKIVDGSVTLNATQPLGYESLRAIKPYMSEIADDGITSIKIDSTKFLELVDEAMLEKIADQAIVFTDKKMTLGRASQLKDYLSLIKDGSIGGMSLTMEQLQANQIPTEFIGKLKPGSLKLDTGDVALDFTELQALTPYLDQLADQSIKSLTISSADLRANMTDELASKLDSGSIQLTDTEPISYEQLAEMYTYVDKLKDGTIKKIGPLSIIQYKELWNTGNLIHTKTDGRAIILNGSDQFTKAFLNSALGRDIASSLYTLTDFQKSKIVGVVGGNVSIQYGTYVNNKNKFLKELDGTFVLTELLHETRTLDKAYEVIESFIDTQNISFSLGSVVKHHDQEKYPGGGLHGLVELRDGMPMTMEQYQTIYPKIKKYTVMSNGSGYNDLEEYRKYGEQKVKLLASAEQISSILNKKYNSDWNNWNNEFRSFVVTEGNELNINVENFYRSDIWHYDQYAQYGERISLKGISTQNQLPEITLKFNGNLHYLTSNIRPIFNYTGMNENKSLIEHILQNKIKVVNATTTKYKFLADETTTFYLTDNPSATESDKVASAFIGSNPTLRLEDGSKYSVHLGQGVTDYRSQKHAEKIMIQKTYHTLRDVNNISNFEKGNDKLNVTFEGKKLVVENGIEDINTTPNKTLQVGKTYKMVADLDANTNLFANYKIAGVYDNNQLTTVVVVDDDSDKSKIFTASPTNYHVSSDVHNILRLVGIVDAKLDIEDFVTT